MTPMKKTIFNLVLVKLVVLIAVFIYTGCKNEKREKDSFNVTFLTDIHLQPERDAVK